MAERDCSHRDVLDKLGLKPGHLLGLDETAWRLDPDLRAKLLARASEAGSEDTVDIVLATVDDRTDVVALLRHWKQRLQPAGGIWLLTPKRGQPGYVDQRELMPAGAEAGLVDNKTCSVSDAVSGMRFVIRRADRARHHPL